MLLDELMHYLVSDVAVLIDAKNTVMGIAITVIVGS